MKINVNNNERIFRILGGAAILTAGAIFGSWLGLIGLIPIATGALGTCPVYSILGVSTCPVDAKAHR